MSKSLIRLVDEAILPAFLIVGAKVISIAFVNSILSLSFYYQNFGKLYYVKSIDARMVNTYSDISVYSVLLIGVVFILIKIVFFSHGKASPSVLLKLAKANKVNFIQTSIELYHILFVWMIFLTGIVIYILTRTISAIDYLFPVFPVFVTFLGIVWIIVKEVEKDIVKKLDQGKNSLV